MRLDGLMRELARAQADAAALRLAAAWYGGDLRARAWWNGKRHDAERQAMMIATRLARLVEAGGNGAMA